MGCKVALKKSRIFTIFATLNYRSLQYDQQKKHPD